MVLYFMCVCMYLHICIYEHVELYFYFIKFHKQTFNYQGNSFSVS